MTAGYPSEEPIAGTALHYERDWAGTGNQNDSPFGTLFHNQVQRQAVSRREGG